MQNRFFFLLCLLAFAPLLSFNSSPGEKDVFSEDERRYVSVATFGLFDGIDYFTVSTDNLRRDGWQFPMPDGIVFRPDFIHDSSVWYIASAEKKTAVKAVMDGVVRLSRKTSLGRTVVIRHPNGLETVYANNAENTVKVGETVQGGQVIARAGASHGTVYTYFSVMVDGVRLDPSVLAEPDGKLKDVLLECRQEQGRIRVLLRKPGEVAECLPHVLPVSREQVFVDLSRPFTELERQHVGVATPGLFDHASSFTVDLSRVERWSYPLPGARVISPYGGVRKNHTGTDLKTVPKDKIRAVFDGVVRFSGVYSAYGNMVVVRHANGLETCYSHNVKNLVRTGDRVKAGETIALVGRTGRATTEHCHFEVRVNGVPFNSDYLFDHATHTLKNCRLTFVRKADGGISVR